MVSPEGDWFQLEQDEVAEVRKESWRDIPGERRGERERGRDRERERGKAYP